MRGHRRRSQCHRHLSRTLLSCLFVLVERTSPLLLSRLSRNVKKTSMYVMVTFYDSLQFADVKKELR
jgi:hypothetical protein